MADRMKDRGMPLLSAESRPGESTHGAATGAGAEAAQPHAYTRLREVGASLRAQYLEIDRRVLASFRIWFGLVLLVDLVRRVPHLTLFYTNDGVLPNHYAIFAPLSDRTFSLFFACSTKAQVSVAFALTALVYTGLTLGYRTKLMQILTLILYSSLISRNLFFEMGGSCSLSLAAGWTVFLPLGDRFSLDAVRLSLSRRREQKASALNDRRELGPIRAPCTTLVVLGLLLQLTAIYFLNFEQKVDGSWKTGDAVHWVLWQNRIATSLAELVRSHEPRWFSPMASWGTLVVEAIAPAMLLTPFVYRWTRSIYFVLVSLMHIGIALFMDVGPYSYVMLALDLLMLPGFWFDRLAARIKRARSERVVVYDPEDPALHWFARVLARLDTFELLTFVDSEDESRAGARIGAPKAALAVGRSGGAWSADGLAAVDALRTTPFGTVIAGSLLGAIVRWLFRVRTPIARACQWLSGRHESAPEPAVFDVPSPARLPRVRMVLREATAALFTFVTLMQIFHDNWWLAGGLPRWLSAGPPGALASIPGYLRQEQGWMMFRSPPRTDGTIVVDATTLEGRHIDPFTGQPPDLDATLHGPLHFGQLFCDYFLHIYEARNAHYRGHLAHYLLNWQSLEGRPKKDRIVSFRVLWVESDSPKRGDSIPQNLRRTVVLEGP
jgi:hypothetical protein